MEDGFTLNTDGPGRLISIGAGLPFITGVGVICARLDGFGCPERCGVPLGLLGVIRECISAGLPCWPVTMWYMAGAIFRFIITTGASFLGGGSMIPIPITTISHAES